MLLDSKMCDRLFCVFKLMEMNQKLKVKTIVLRIHTPTRKAYYLQGNHPRCLCYLLPNHQPAFY